MNYTVIHAVIYDQDLHCRKTRKYEIYKCRPYKDEEEEDNEGERPVVDDVSDGQEKTVLLEEQVG